MKHQVNALSLLVATICLSACGTNSGQAPAVTKTSSSSTGGATNALPSIGANTPTVTTPAVNNPPVNQVPLTGRAALLNDLYKKMLGRAPEAAALSYWSTKDCAQIMNGVALSDEFQTRLGGATDISYVQQLYLGVLGRPYDDVGLSHYANTLYAQQYVANPRVSARDARAAVATVFVQSAEAAARCATYAPL